MDVDSGMAKALPREARTPASRARSQASGRQGALSMPEAGLSHLCGAGQESQAEGGAREPPEQALQQEDFATPRGKHIG